MGLARRRLSGAWTSVLVTLLLVILPVVALGRIATWQGAERLYAYQATQSADTARAVASRANDRLSHAAERVRSIWAIASTTGDPASDIVRKTESALGADYVGLAYQDEHGSVVAAEPAAFATAVPADIVTSRQGFGVSGFQRWSDEVPAMFVLAVPIGNANSRGTALVGMDARAVILSERQLLARFTDVYLSDRAGASLSTARAQAGGDPLLATDSIPASVERGPVASAPVGDLGWQVTIGGPTFDIGAQIETVTNAYRVAGAVLIVVLVAGTLVLARSFRRVLRQRGRLRAVQHAAHVGGWEYDGRSGRISVSEEVLRIYGLARGEGDSRYDAVLERTHPEDRAHLAAEVRRALREQTAVSVRHRIVRTDGAVRVIETRAEPVVEGGSERTRLRGTAQDITDLLVEEREQAELGRLVETADVALVRTTLEGVITSWNARAETLFGYPATEALGSPLEMLSPPGRSNDLQQRARRGETVSRHETERVRRDGSRIPVSLSVAPLTDESGAVTGAAWTFRDLSPIRRAEAELARAASHDALTGLSNRHLLTDRLEQALRLAQRSGVPLAVLTLDVDHFRDVSEALGPAGADALLIDLSARLVREVRAVDTVARLGADVFAILVPDADEAAAVLVAARLRSAVGRPFVAGDRELDVSASLGVAVHPAHGADAAALLRHSDLALEAAKHSAAGYALYAPTPEGAGPSRAVVLTELRQAIERGHLRLLYQPEIDLRTRETVRAEALVRWEHAERGLLAPGEFIPIVEDTGLVGPLTAWVVGEALGQCRAWADAEAEMPVAINLSARSLIDPDVIGGIHAGLERAGVSGRMLTVEITESVLVADALRAREAIAQLRTLGVRVSLDDFGTGYSSFAYLERLPIEELKIDRAFVEGLAGARGTAIVGAMIDLGHRLGLEVVAEGIETEQALVLLRALGCDTAQGYLLARPMSGDDLIGWLHQERQLRSKTGTARGSGRHVPLAS